MRSYSITQAKIYGILLRFEKKVLMLDKVRNFVKLLEERI